MVTFLLWNITTAMLKRTPKYLVLHIFVTVGRVKDSR